MSASSPSITIFAVPKAFEGHTGIIQRNAVNSWSALRPAAQVILFGDETGTAEIAAELGLEHVPDVARTSGGTPLLDSVFRQAQEQAVGRVMAYVNADLVLLADFSDAIQQLASAGLERFLMIGRRVDVDINEAIDFRSAAWPAHLRSLAHRGSLASMVCKDYFVFPKPLYREIPAFAVGRGNWDNWIVYHAHQRGIPVVDATRATTVFHQKHDYRHLRHGGRRTAYWRGEEAQRNRVLAGGRHLIRGCAPSWYLTASGEIRRAVPIPLLHLLADAPRFARLCAHLMLAR